MTFYLRRRLKAMKWSGVWVIDVLRSMIDTKHVSGARCVGGLRLGEGGREVGRRLELGTSSAWRVAEGGWHGTYGCDSLLVFINMSYILNIKHWSPVDDIGYQKLSTLRQWCHCPPWRCPDWLPVALIKHSWDFLEAVGSDAARREDDCWPPPASLLSQDVTMCQRTASASGLVRLNKQPIAASRAIVCLHKRLPPAPRLWLSLASSKRVRAGDHHQPLGLAVSSTNEYLQIGRDNNTLNYFY